MANSEVNLADRSGSLVESHKGYDPRIIFFYFVVAALLLTLVGGLAYQQLFKTDQHSDRERKQSQRRVLVPGPRGNIYDREGRILVGNRSRFSAVLYLDELRPELWREQIRIRRNYREMDDKDMPSRDGLQTIARVSVAQRYLDQINTLLHRDPSSPDARIDAGRLKKHFQNSLLLPYTLVDDLSREDYARLIETLPVNSPLQVYSSSSRDYPYKSAAAHTLGFVRVDDEAEAEDFPGEDLHTFKIKGAIGKDGLEKAFDEVLQGTPGGSIFRVDPSGFRINPPLEQRRPVQGKSITTSLDIDLQLAAEETIGDQVGAAVAIDVETGEVLVLASKPDYDLSQFSPRASQEIVAQMNATGAWTNLAVNGFFAPGSTFKILTTIAGLRAGVLTPDQPIVTCNGYYMVGNRRFPCDVGHGHHGNVLLPDAIAYSCDIYYYRAGELMTPDVLAAEARRFHFDQPTGIELPGEQRRMIVPDPQWKQKREGTRWMPGDTANMSIGQGYLDFSPLQMACFVASVARDEVYTTPTLLHRPDAPPQRHEKIGLTSVQRAALIEGMEGAVTKGTGSILSTPDLRIPGLRIAAKTGTAQKDVTIDGKQGKINLAWIVCFAPVEHPEIALAVMVRGDTIGEDFYGGRNAGPVASVILKKYFEKKSAGGKQTLVSPFKTR